MTESVNSTVLVFGIGNILMGDEGVGVHVVEKLSSKDLPGEPDIIDGGTGGFHLLSIIQSYETIVMIDASLDGLEPGTISILEPKYAKDFPKSLSAHDIGLKDLLESASLLGKLPRIILITVTVDSYQEVTMDLSERVNSAIPLVIEEVKEILREL
jgi:hydrogenase maturation protease